MTSVWDDVVGQEPAVEVLRTAISDPSAMTHAWLVTGPPGSGRSNAARAFAAALLCFATMVAVARTHDPLGFLRVLGA